MTALTRFAPGSTTPLPLRLSSAVPILPQLLKSHGYRVAAFTGQQTSGCIEGLDQRLELHDTGTKYSSMAQSAPRALEWLRQHGDERFFVCLHAYDAHGGMPQAPYQRTFDPSYRGALSGSNQEYTHLRETQTLNKERDGAFHLAQIQRRDAQFLQGVEPGSLAFVHSSHCLEHLVDPRAGLAAWFGAIKPGGFLIVPVPDEDLYEQGVWPSTHNRDHKWTFTMLKARPWSEASINVLELLSNLGPAADVEKVALLNSTFRYDLPRFDQTLTPIGECGIEFVVRKRTARELTYGGLVRDVDQPAPAERKHFNQYRADHAHMKTSAPPFEDESEL